MLNRDYDLYEAPSIYLQGIHKFLKLQLPTTINSHGWKWLKKNRLLLPFGFIDFIKKIFKKVYGKTFLKKFKLLKGRYRPKKRIKFNEIKKGKPHVTATFLHMLSENFCNNIFWFSVFSVRKSVQKFFPLVKSFIDFRNSFWNKEYFEYSYFYKTFKFNIDSFKIYEKAFHFLERTFYPKKKPVGEGISISIVILETFSFLISRLRFNRIYNYLMRKIYIMHLSKIIVDEQYHVYFISI